MTEITCEQAVPSLAQTDFQVFAAPVPNEKPSSWLQEQATSGTPIWAVCSKCDHSRLMDPSDLLALTGPMAKALSGVANRMRCRACGSKACELMAATPIPEHAL
jgi:hypothetical protein